MKKRYLLLIVLSTLLMLEANAYDVQIDNIYYNLDLDAKTAEVTYEELGDSPHYTGDVIIPPTIVYDGETYTVTKIGEFAFLSCSALTSVTLPNSLTSIDYQAFAFCDALTTVTNPGSLESIGYNVFWFCSSLTSLDFLNGVKSIGDYAFENCSGLTSVTIPNSVTSIGGGVFSSCENLITVTINSDAIASQCQLGGFLEGNVSNIIFGQNVRTIGDYSCCGMQLTSITIENGVTEIGINAFEGCSRLTSITIPNSVTSIGGSAFYGCVGIKSITLPSSLENIGFAAFLDSNIEDIYCTWTTLPEIDFFSVLYGANPEKIWVHIPIGCIENYDMMPLQYCLAIEDSPDLFPDCPEGEVRKYSLWLRQWGIVQGEEGKLLPNREATRAEIAKSSLYGVYSGSNNVGELWTDDYSSVYTDLQDVTTYYYQAAKALLYLDYGDGVTPFDRDRLAFEPNGKIARDHVLKVLLETFDIQPDLEGTNNPFPNDANVVQVATTQPRLMGYIRKAAELGIISTDNEEFRPYAYCTRGEAFVMLARTMVAKSELVFDYTPQREDYFQPLNTTQKTISLGVGLELGNFQHYSKPSFFMDGVMPLTFSHSYNSYNTTLPSVFFGVNGTDIIDNTYQPLGDGWSHTYHSFVSVTGSLEDNSIRAAVHWGGGKIDVYKPDGSRMIPESIGVYDEFEFDGNEIVVTTKKQIKYRFALQSGASAKVLYLKSITDRNNNTLIINYEDGVNDGKRISSVTDGHRSLSFYYLDDTNLLSEVKDTLNRSVSFSYFDNPQTLKKQLQSFTDAEGNTTTYEYGDLTTVGASKLLSRIQLPKGNYIENEYDANRRLTKTVSGLDGVPTKQTSVSVNTSFWQGAGDTSSSVVVLRDGQSYSYSYAFNDNNLADRIIGPEGFRLEFQYTNSIHPELPTRFYSDMGVDISCDYDSKGNITAFYNQHDLFGPTVLLMSYDNMNNMTSLTDANDNTITYSYDSKGNLTGVSAPEDVSIEIEVDEKGLPIEITDGMGISTLLEYNEYGNLTKSVLPALNLAEQINYDGASRVVSTIDALGRTNSFDYDDNDMMLKRTNPLNLSTWYAYDTNGNMTSITNAKNGVTTLNYDNTTDWLTSVSFGKSTKEFRYNKDGTLLSYIKPDGTTLNYAYDGLGRIKSDGIRSYTYLYDDLPHLSYITEKDKIVGLHYYKNRINRISYENYNNYYAYDSNGNITGTNSCLFNYDGLNRLNKVESNGVIILYHYRKDSQLSYVDYYKNSDMIMNTEYTYDEVGRLTGKTTKLNSGTVIADYSFVLDKVGNVIAQTATEPYQEIPMAPKTINYEYDDENRITKAGNINFTFDKNGNMTKRATEDYTWNLSNQLTNAGGTEITYDPLGFISSYGDITFTTDPLGIGNVLSDSRSGAQYIYGLGLEARIVNGVASFYVTDIRGSVVAVVDENGTVTHKYQYDEFGNVLQKEEADYNPFQYVGKHGVMYLNDHLYYMRARHYDPTIGRFISEDPIWSTNLYPYTENNPIMGIDPEGELSWSIGDYKGEVTHYGGEDQVLMTGPGYRYGTYFNFEDELTGDMGKIMDVLREAKKYKYDGDNNHFYTQGNKRIKSPSKYLWGSLFKHISKDARQALKNNFTIDKDEQYILNRDIWGQEMIDKGREIYGGITRMGVY